MTTIAKHSRGFSCALRALITASLLSASTFSTAQQAVSKHPAAASVSNYGSLPLSFEANRGQSDASVRFIAHGDSYSLFLTDREAVLAMGKAGTQADSIRMKLAGAAVSRSSENPSLRTPVGEDELPGKVNYFIGNDPAKWRADLPTYSKVRYPSVYPGVDLVYYGNQRQLEYDFVVAPAASPAPIRLKFAGAKKIQLATDGDLILTGEHGQAVLHKPVVYQDENGQRQPIAGSFKLLAKNTVGFALGSYDRSRQLIIDPVLVYSTYFGGTGSGSISCSHFNNGMSEYCIGQGDQGNGIALDSSGNAYVVGTTYSADFPVTSGAYQAGNPAADTSNGASTVFVSKLNSTGTALVYSTYLGGSGGDEGYGIALDSTNHPYVTGATYSTDFPVTCGAIQSSNNEAASGAPTGFVTKLNSAGNGLLYSTYLGGSGNHASPAQGDVAQAIAVDGLGNAYLTGYTYSADFPVTDAAFQTAFAGSAQISNVFVTKINPDGAALAYSTFLGGGGSVGGGDYGNAIALDGAGDAFVVGSTASSNFPLAGANATAFYDGSLSGMPTAFVTELNLTGADEVYSLLLGGSGGDSAQAIAVDAGGSAYVAGNTNSSDSLLTDGVVEGAKSGMGGYISPAGVCGGTNYQNYTCYSVPSGIGAFVSKLAPGGATLVYSTYLEGMDTAVTGIAVDSSGDAYIAGYASAAGAGNYGGFQSTPDALPIPTGRDSGFLVKLDPLASVFNYATLLGGSFIDEVNAIALDAAGNAYLTGAAFSPDFPTAGPAFQTENKAASVLGSNAFVSKFALASEVNQTAYPSLPVGLQASLPAPSTWSYNCQYSDVFLVSISGAVYPPSVNSPIPTGTLAGWLSDGSPYDTQPILVGTSLYSSSFNYADPFYSYYNWADGGNGLYFGTEGGGGSTVYIGFGDTQDVSWGVYFAGDSVYPATSGGDGVLLTAGEQVCNSDDSKSSLQSARLGRNIQPLDLQTRNLHQNGPTRLGLNPLPPSSMRGDGTAAKRDVRGQRSLPQSSIPEQQANRAGMQALSAAATPATASCSLPALTITAASASRLYGAANPSFTDTVEGLKNGDSVTVALSTNATPASSVGYYPIAATVSGAAAANYRVLVEDGILDVTPAPLTVTIDNNWRLYGGANPAFKQIISGLVNGDKVSVTDQSTAIPASPVGSYAVTAVIGGPLASNYGPVTVVPATLKVLPAPLTLIAKDVSVTYGQSPTLPLQYNLYGFVNGDTSSVVSGAPILTTNVTSTTPHGTYPIDVQVGTLTAENYRIGTIGPQGGSGAVSVTKAPLTVTANTVTMSKGGTVPPLTYSLTGFANGDDASVVSGTAQLSTTVNASTKGGEYPISVNVSGLSAANYYFVPAVHGGVVTVTK
jgi:type IV secretory pathway protease TraF